MTSERRRSMRRAIGALCVACSAAGPGAATEWPDWRVGGVVGFGLEAQRAPGAFRWDLNAARADSALAVLRGGATAPYYSAFVSVATGVDLDDTRHLGLHEAMFAAHWRSVGGDSALVRFFYERPGTLWFDHPLSRTWSAVRASDAVGVRADVRSGLLHSTFAVVQRATGDLPDRGSAWIARLRADVPAPWRIGATWSHETPEPTSFEPVHRDRIGVDLSGAWRDHTAALEYTTMQASYATEAAREAAEPGMRTEFEFDRSRRLTDVLPSTSTLRAELRLRQLAIGGFGHFAVVPSYRAIGANATDPLVLSERDFGAPRRGIEGPRVATWFEPSFWPGWVSWIYDRHSEFRDGDRKIIAQQLETQAWVHSAVRVRAAYTQRDVHLPQVHVREHHDDLMAEVVAEEGGARLRVQAARLDLNTESARTTGALEAGARIAGRLQAGMRLTVAVRAASVRRGAFLVARWVELRKFEVALQYGSEGLGDGTDPALDADLAAAGALDDRVRLLVRGWF